jgi:hypothetical protein
MTAPADVSVVQARPRAWVAFHLMDQDHVTRAPWGITTLVSCLPVLVLGVSFRSRLHG